MSGKRKRAPDQPAENAPEYRDAMKRYTDHGIAIGGGGGSSPDWPYNVFREKDARIAELEAKADQLRLNWQAEADARRDDIQRAEQAEAELAALRGRRCATCRWYEPGAMDPASCGVLQGFVPHNNFWCCDWAAREETP